MTAASHGEISAALLRAGIYQCLAEAFAYPVPELAESLSKRRVSLLAWRTHWPESVRIRILEALATFQTADLPALAEAHVRLFGPAALCPLTETSWGDAGRLLGKAAQLADISGFYGAFNVHPREVADSVPEDHLAMELEFMSVLCLKEAHALNAGLGVPLEITRDAQEKFLEQHLATWVDFWAERLAANSPPPFYRALAETLQSMMGSETSRLGLKPVPIRARLADSETGSDTFTCPLASTS